MSSIIGTDAALGKSHIPVSLTVAEKLKLLTIKLPIIITKANISFILRTFNAIWRLVTGRFHYGSPRPVRHTPGFSRSKLFAFPRIGPWLRRTLTLSILASFTSTLSLRELRSFQPPTGETLERFARSSKIDVHYQKALIHVPPAVEDAATQRSAFPPANLHFLDFSSSAHNTSLDPTRPVILYLHGGGYVFPMGPMYPAFLRRLSQTLPGAAATVAVLEYTLAPGLAYPGQLAQASAALSHLLQTWPASQIIVGGDSAGGNLALALLAHLRSPHPHIRALQLPSNEKLRGVFAISPRCSNDPVAPSYARNAGRDIITPRTVAMFTSNWRPVAGHVWAAPAAGSADFWYAATRDATEKVLLLAGEDESYADDIAAVALKMGASSDKPSARVLFVEAAGEMHVQAVMDFGRGVAGVSLSALLEWLAKL